MFIGKATSILPGFFLGVENTLSTRIFSRRGQTGSQRYTSPEEPAALEASSLRKKARSM